LSLMSTPHQAGILREPARNARRVCWRACRGSLRCRP
jgi:hypothetical protein